MNERLEYGASERTGEDADVRIVGHRAPPPRDPGELTEHVFVVAAVGRGPVRFGEAYWGLSRLPYSSKFDIRRGAFDRRGG